MRPDRKMRDSSAEGDSGWTSVLGGWAFLLRLESSYVVCFEQVDSIFELVNVAISLLFAFLSRSADCLWVGFEESSFDSRCSLRMPILVGSAVAVNPLRQSSGGRTNRAQGWRAGPSRRLAGRLFLRLFVNRDS